MSAEAVPIARPIRWGVLSAAKVAHDFVWVLQNLLSSSDCVVQAIAARKLEDAQTFAKTYNIPMAYGSYHDLGSDPNVDIVYICSPHPFHASHAIMMLEAGKHVFVEKPIAMNSVELQKLAAVARKSGKFVQEAIFSRFCPALVKAKQLVQAGEIGQLQHIQADFGVRVPTSNTRLWDANLAGGCLLDYGIYLVSLCSWMYNGQSPQTIQATGDTEKGVDTNVVANIKYGPNQYASFVSSLLVDTDRAASMIGTKGRINIHPRWHGSTTITVKRTGQSDETITIEGPNTDKKFNFSASKMLKYEIEEVVRCLRAGEVESPSMRLSESVKIIATLDEIRRQVGVIYPEETTEQLDIQKTLQAEQVANATRN